MSLAPYVQILGRGQGRSRSFTLEEAEAALGIVLKGEAAPEAVGAMLMLMRMKGEVAPEIAGFTQAARAQLGGWQALAPALDWPSYAAGRTRGLPWFLLAAKLVAQAGYPVLLHGWNSHQAPLASVRAALPALGIGMASDPEAARDMLAASAIAYVPLEALSPELFALLQLRQVFGLRSCINTVLRVLDPGGAAASVQGVFHPSYRELQADAGELLGQQRLTVIKGGGGEFERHPSKEIALFGLRAGAPWAETAPGLLDETRRLAEGPEEPGALLALWQGGLRDEFAEAIVLGTAALALDCVTGDTDGAARAAALWENRARG